VNSSGDGDIVLHNGRVLTQATLAPPSAVLVRGGRIAAVGDSADLLRDAGATRRLDLAGRTLIPGFNDAHAHIWKIGHLLTTMLDLRRVTSIAALVDAVARFAEPLRPTAGCWGAATTKRCSRSAVRRHVTTWIACRRTAPSS
jgi:predicted amidohydrolase YtcJ